VRSVAEGHVEYQINPDIPKDETLRLVKELEKQMKAAAKELAFEQAALLRDQVFELRAMLVEESDLPPWKKMQLLSGNLED